MSTPDTADPEAYEATHVHSVYNSIAPHFSATRQKPWPLVREFLLALPAGSVGLDVGCGNGKYLAVNPHIHILGSDRSDELVKLARYPPRFSEKEEEGGQKGEEVCVADGLDLPYRKGCVDFAISIAVIHHFSTVERRRDVIRQLLSMIHPQGRVLVFVWALEQASSRRGWDVNDKQDTLVSWVMRGPEGMPNVGETFQRYYHLYKEGELVEDVVAVGGEVIKTGYDRDNWWVICGRKQTS